jgi:serine/threonine protein kinase
MSGGATAGMTSWPLDALPYGTTLHGYRIEQVLGSGGFGVTYLARDLLGQRFAIKEYFPRQFAARRGIRVVALSNQDIPLFDQCKDRFLNEARALVLLGQTAEANNGIVRVQTYFEANDTCFMVMDYVEGTSLANAVRQQPDGLPAARVQSLLMQLLSAMRLVHQAGLLHRDIKPANIIVGHDDKVVLIDFGASRETAHNQASAYTQVYSDGYAPPEQMFGSYQAEFSDIYAVGAVCYRCIGGTLVNAMQRGSALAEGKPDPQPAAEIIGAGRYPQRMLATIDAALAIDPRRRPKTADEMSASLGWNPQTDDTTVVPARPTELPRRGTWRYIACAAIAVALIGVPLPTTYPPSAVGLVEAPPQTARSAPPTQAPVAEAAIPQAISPLDRAQAALSVPCAVLIIEQSHAGLRAIGPALPGRELDSLLTELRRSAPVEDETRPVDRSACAPIVALGAVMRRSWQVSPHALDYDLELQDVPGGARFRIDVDTAQPVVYADVYSTDGLVHHLLQPTRQDKGRRHIDDTLTLPPGRHLVVAIGAPQLLDLGPRPATENAGVYLALLRPRLESAPATLAADLGVAEVRAVQPAGAQK